MENLTFGIITLIVCSIGYFYALQFAKPKQYHYALALIILCGLILRFYTAADFFLHEWDERYHALVAKNLIHHPFVPTLYEHPILPFDYTHWTSNHIWVHKQPFPLWIMAFSLWAFGINEFALRLPSILLSSFAIFLTYKIALYFINHRMALLAAFLHSINGLIIELTAGRTATDHIDLFFHCLIELGIFFAIRSVQTKKHRFGYSVLTGISIGLAILTKWLPALIVIGIWGLLTLHHRWKWKVIFFHLGLICCIIFLVATPWQFYILQAFPLEAARTFSYNRMHLYEGLGGHGKPWYFYLERIRINYGELIYLPIIWLLIKKLKKLFLFHRVDLSLLGWIVVPIIFFSFAATKMQGYMVICAPAFFILTAMFYKYLSFYRSKFGVPKIIIKMIMLLFIILPIRYSVERIKPFHKVERTPQWRTQIVQFNKQYPLNETTIIFNHPRPIEMMFYTSAIAYSHIPSQTVLDSLLEQSYNLYQYSNNQLLPILKE